MFKFIHAADIHLDSPLVGLSQHEEAPAEAIRVATRTALTRLIDYAISQQVAFLVIAGDLYDGDWKDFGTGISFNHEMRKLESANIPVYLIYGNHDAESRVTKSLTLPSNVHVFPTKNPDTFQHPTLPVSLHGQGFATPAVTENLASNYPEPVGEHYNIGLLHTNLGDADGHGNYAPSNLSQLVGHGYHYWALGHIHQRKIHHANPHVVYSGNTQGRHINETGGKGCYLVTVNDELETEHCHFQELDSVRWDNVEIDCSGLTDEHQVLTTVRDRINKALNDVGGRLLAIRLTLTGHTTLHESLHAEHTRLTAEARNIAIEIDHESIWLEGLRLKTQSLLDPKELAEQDDLTAFVLAALEAFDPSDLPMPVANLQKKLPADAIKALAGALKPGTNQERKEIGEDVTAIVLQAIATSDSAS